MIEQGTVVEVRGGRLVVEMERTARCGSCRACTLLGEGKMRIRVDAPEGISLGDRVEVEIPTTRMKAIVAVFVLPLAAALLGAILGSYLAEVLMPNTGRGNLLAIVLAVVFLAAAYVRLYVYERTSGGRRGQPTVRRLGQGAAPTGPNRGHG